MKGIYLLCLANLRKNKVRNFLIGLILFISALIFSTAVGTLVSMNGLYETTFNKLSASHDLLFFAGQEFNVQEIEDWFEKRPEVEASTALPQVSLPEKVYVNEQKLDKQISLVEMPAQEIRQDKLAVVEGKVKNKPGIREVWVPAGIAYANDIKLGDKITVSTNNNPIALQVSALVVDPLFSNNLFDPGRFWLAPGELATMFSYSKLQEVQLGIRYKDQNQADQVWRDFEENLGQPFTGIRLEYDMLKNINTIAYKIVGGILLVFSLIIILAVLYIISNTIKSSILSNYRTIGVLKSDGFSFFNLIFAYLVQYFILSGVAVAAGVFLSTYTTKLVLSDIIKALGLGKIPVSQTIPNLISAVGLIGFILLTTYLVALKTDQVKPAQAIRYGKPVKDHSSGKTNLLPRLKKLPLSFSIAVNDILTDKLQSVFILVITLLVSFTALFAINFSDSLWASLEKGSVWGFSEGQIKVERDQQDVGGLSHDLTLRKIKANQAVEEVVSIVFSTNTEFIKPDGSTTNVVGKAFAGDLDELGYKNIEGRHPEEKNEIALATNLSKALDKTIGDEIEVYIEGKKMNFLVTSIYQAYNFGREFRTTMEAVKAVNSTIEPLEYDVLITEEAAVDKVIEELDHQLGAAGHVRSSKEELMNLFGSMVLFIIIALLVIAGMFILLGLLTIYNHTSITVIKQEKNHGIFKAFGMTPTQIRLAVVFKVIFLTLVALIVSGLLTLFLASKLALMIFRVAGLAYFPLVINPLYSIGISLLIVAINSLGAWLASRRVLDLNVRTLIVE